MVEELHERQEGERVALSAIFYDCLEDLTKDDSEKSIDILLYVTPSKGSIKNFEIFTEVCLHVTCPPFYPEELLEFKVKKSKGLTPENLNQLNQELLEVARTKKGSESIYDLWQCAEDILYQKNKELFIQREIEEQRKKDEKMEKEKEVRELDEELFRRLNSKPVETPPPSPIESSNSSEENKEVCSHKSVCSIDLGSRQILRGKCLVHFGLNHSVHFGIDEESGKNYTVHEWKLIDSDLTSEQQIQKQIRAIEQEFNSTIKTLKHDNLVSYYNILSKRLEDHYIIYTVEEQINGYNCNTLFINCNITIGDTYTRYIVKSVLKALDYLHSKNIVHRNLSGSCIFIDNKDVVKVANYATYRRLSDLVENKLCVNYNKKKDIEKFGNFVYSLVSGIPVSDDAEINIPVSLSPDLYDFLKMCKDDDQQCTTADLLKHKFVNQSALDSGQGDDESENRNFEMQRRNLIRNTSANFDQSRISSEFELIASLGNGAFGSVHKYKNKLDQRFYAIKKIQLNTKNKRTIKKIKNEVRLLSRLNHQNVVRYFTSWIEEVEGDDRSSSCEAVASGQEKVKSDELTQYDDIENLAPSISKNKVSTTYSHLQSQCSSDTDSSDEDEDDNNSDSKKSESDSIVFANSENVDEDFPQDSIPSVKMSVNLKKTYMYIQMEFCEKSTLRSAIDDTSLCSDKTRIERYLRQILEGLDHIHLQGMIHRDLKPANIFLDLKDRVKIGDFGLATRNLKSKLNEDNSQKNELDSFKDVGESKTGQVGTSYYIAPEVQAEGKVVYNSKVDIYSLGIILFEMCYKQFPTNMERYSVLTELRKKEINFPNDFESTLVKKQRELISLLLDHDVSKRPTVQDILNSNYAPPPVFEDRGIFNMMAYTLANPQHNAYKMLTANLFKQKLSLIRDLTYDNEESSSSYGKSVDTNYDLVKKLAIKVFTNHGAKNMFTPLLMPLSDSYSFQNTKNCVKLMTHGGDIVSIPSDLRVNFARYVAWNSLYLVKRYSIERVFSEQKVFGVCPKGSYECAFDIVTPTPGKHFLPDGEVLHAVYEVLSQLPTVTNENVIIHLNHPLLIKAIMFHFKIEQKLHPKIIEIFHGHETKTIILETDLANLNLTSNQISNLTGIFFSNNEPGKVPNIVKTVQNSKVPEAKKYGEEAEQELTQIINVAREMGVEFGICINPGLMYNIQQFSGMICKFLYNKKKYKSGRLEMLAAGGRYDSMITHYRNLLGGTHLAKNVSQSGVGVSIFLDKVVQILQKEQKFSDVLICLQDEWPLHRITMVLRSLSSLGIEWILFQTNSIEEAVGFSGDLRIPHIVVLLKDYNENNILLKSWNDDRSKYREKRYCIAELVEELKRTLRKDSQASDGALLRSESKIYVEKPHNDSPTIVFHTSVNSKKRFESQINSKLDDIRERYHGPIVVLAFDLDMDIIKMLAAYLEFETLKSFQRSMKNIIERNSKQKVLQEVCELIYEYKTKSNKPFVILYSLKESSFRYI